MILMCDCIDNENDSLFSLNTFKYHLDSNGLLFSRQNVNTILILINIYSVKDIWYRCT